jgi:hypothetical protein
VTLPPHLFLQYLGLQKYITVSGFLLFDASWLLKLLWWAWWLPV